VERLADVHVRVAPLRQGRRQLRDDLEREHEAVRAQERRQREHAPRARDREERGRLERGDDGPDGGRHGRVGVHDDNDFERNGCNSSASSNQGGAVSVANVSLPARLLLDHFSVSPSVVHRSTSDVSVTVHVSDTCGQSVTGAMVYATAVPFNQFSVQPEQPTDANGNATITMHKQQGFPAANKQHLLVMMLRARKPGESVLGGISIRRLVSSRVDISL
jgi:hypothetical protein